MQPREQLDPVFAADRERGSTPPESSEASSNVVGRPLDEGQHAVGFHESSETPDVEREALSDSEALDAGGSFDGLGLPVADDETSAASKDCGP